MTEFELRIGDSLRRDRTGLAKADRSRVAARSFFGKGWTNYELDGVGYAGRAECAASPTDVARKYEYRSND